MTEKKLPERFEKPKGWLWGQFTNARGAALRFGTLTTHKTPVAHIVYIEGLSEYAEKTFELARDFNAMACNFSVIDRHGQGQSPRFLKDREKQHTHGIDHDVDDIIRYCRAHIPAGEPIVLLGHSTGGLLALHALEREPSLFRGAILTAPLLGFENKLLKDREGAFARLPMPALLGERYIPGGAPWHRRDHKLNLHKPEAFSSDPVRNKVHDHWPTHEKSLRTGSPTMGWIIEMCRAIMTARQPDFLGRIRQPVLVFTAGRDVLIDNRPTHDLARQLAGGTIKNYENGRHELLLETDDIRGDILRRCQDFLKNRL